MRHHESGWWIPDIMGAPGSYIGRLRDLTPQMARLRGRNVCVQAGGHIGIYPKMLSTYFDRVYTFEPEAENFGCLVRNVPDNVFAARGVLSDRRGFIALRRHSKSSGGHQVGKDAGDVPMYRIDDFEFDALDALILDVEGYEMNVLRGALDTIAKYKPLIVCEENKTMIRHGFVYGDIEKLLVLHNYQIVDRYGEDIVLST